MTMLGWGGAMAQTVTPSALAVDAGSPVCSASSVVEHVCVQLPPATTANKIDFFGLFDDTSSFQDIVPTLAAVFTQLVGELETALPGVDFGFGVGRFEDYGGPGFGFGGESQSGRPFTLNQPIVTAAAAGSAAARNQLIVDALGRSAPGNGGDAPEAALEALYQVAMGAGFDGNGDGVTNGLDGQQVAGSLAAQSMPDASGDVPAFSTLAPSVVRAGSIGGAGFRPDAIHLVILATDQCAVAPFDPAAPIPEELGANGVTVPITEFACSSTNAGDTRFGFTSMAKEKGTGDPTVAPSGAARVPAVIEALNAAGIGVIGAFPRVEGSEPRSGPRLGPTLGPDAFLTALARLTGTVDSTGTPLVFDVDDIGPVLRAAVVDAISAAASRPIDVRLVPLGAIAGIDLLPGGDSVQVRPGEQACFDVTLAGSGQPQGQFALGFQEVASGRVLGSIPVTVACAVRCGDGALDAALGEQCDAGAANGASGSCCDATCRVATAGATCQPASGCTADAVCDGISSTCPQATSLDDGALCDDGDATTGISACVGAVCQGVEIGVEIPSEVPGVRNPVRIPVVLGLGDGLERPTAVQIQTFVSCADVPTLESCTTRGCRQVRDQLTALCPGSASGVTSARAPRAPAGLVPVTGRTSRKLKRSRRGQARVRLKLNRTGRILLARSTRLPVVVLVTLRERRGDTLTARFDTIVRR
jgi:hypothetical protein